MPPKSTTPLILVSNDDGIQAPGIQALASALRKLGRVVVVAPNRQQSASSHSLTLHRPLRVVEHGKDAYSVDGTPTDCITLAAHTILKKKPDLVVSGINQGANLGDDVHYSGTVSAAVEASLMGIPAIAVSLVAWGDDKTHFQTAASYAVRIARKVLAGNLKFQSKIGNHFVLNVNVPNVPPSGIKGYRFTRLGKRNFGEVIFEKTDPRRKKYYWIGGDDRTFYDIPGSDGNVIQEKMVSITPLQIDLTHYPLLEEMRSWKL